MFLGTFLSFTSYVDVNRKDSWGFTHPHAMRILVQATPAFWSLGWDRMLALAASMVAPIR